MPKMKSPLQPLKFTDVPGYLILLSLLCSLWSPLHSAAAENPLDSPWQLLIDDICIQDLSKVTRTLHQPVKYAGNPVLKGDVPWAQNPYLYGTVIYDEKTSLYKMWYMSYNHGMPLEERTPFLYATSLDGIHWDLPNLGLYEFRGSKENNIILTNYGYHDQYNPSVIQDETETDPKRRYKMLYWDYPHGEETYGDAGMCVAFSPDGIHWERYANNPVLYAMKKERSISDVMDVLLDKRNGTYVAYTKGWAEPWPKFRQIVRTQSTDFIHWSEPEVVLSHAFTDADPQSYGMPVFQYEELYLGLLRSYKKPGDETIDIQLAVSRDGIHWDRVANQQTFLPLGPKGTWDSGMLFTAPPVVRNGQIEIYYGGWDGPHNASERNGAIGLATLRKDGFVSLDAGNEPGELVTKPMKNSSGTLRINADVKQDGWLKAELLDELGNVLDGYGLDECIALNMDGIDMPVRWKAKVCLPDNKTIRLRFRFCRASLYSFHAGPIEILSR